MFQRGRWNGPIRVDWPQLAAALALATSLASGADLPAPWAVVPSGQRLEHTFRVNVIAMFNIAREALPHMRPGGTIVNTASIQAYEPSPAILDYAATKGAIVAFTKGIRVNCVAPDPYGRPSSSSRTKGRSSRSSASNRR
jgi:NAD(P)-dependent dehydrogenase (short-subunit alcohol dehydrogenase family)